MSDVDPEIEHSPLGGEFKRDGILVRVEIYRLRDQSECWALEVVDHEGASTVWDETFPTDQDAHQAFLRTVEQEGIRTFLNDNAGTVH